MRILLSHPTGTADGDALDALPLGDLGAALVRRGHEVTLLVTDRQPRSVSDRDGVRVVRRWRPPAFHIARRYEEMIECAPGLAWELRRTDADIVHAFHVVDAWTAVAARRLTRQLPLVFSLGHAPERKHLVSRRYRLEMNSRAARGAASVTVPSEAAATAVRRYLLREPVVVPLPSDRDWDEAAGRYEGIYESILVGPEPAP